jgi:hypothetical protein
MFTKNPIKNHKNHKEYIFENYSLVWTFKESTLDYEKLALQRKALLS